MPHREPGRGNDPGKDFRVRHRTRIEQTPNGRYQWRCTCGQYGDPWRDLAEAGRWAKEHEREPTSV